MRSFTMPVASPWAQAAITLETTTLAVTRDRFSSVWSSIYQMRLVFLIKTIIAAAAFKTKGYDQHR